VSPILVRPVREQLEHDRVIRLLLVRLKRKGDIVANIGESQTVPVRVGQVQIFPDLVLTSTDRTHKLLGTVEVETAESVNHLEAMAQWAHLGRVRAPFHLYVPVGSIEIARRLATEYHVNVAEIWSFHSLGDQTRFTLVHRSAPEVAAPAPEPRPAPVKRAPAVERPAPVKRAPAVERPAPAPRSATTRAAAPARAAVKRPVARKTAPPRKTASRPARAARTAVKPARAQKGK
jgi:hypothetical protein